MSRRVLTACALLVTLACAPALAEPAGRIQAGPLVIIHEDPAYERLARELADRGEYELNRICTALGLPPPAYAEVHLLPRKGGTTTNEAGLPLGPDWAAGITLGSRPIIVLRTAEEHASGGAQRTSQVFAHELVHLVAIQALGEHHASLPAWLQEGTAAHLAFEWRVTDTGRALRFAIGGSFTPLSRLRRDFRGDPQQIGDAYFQSRAFVGWLVETEGLEPFRELWGRLAQGEDFDRAFHLSYGRRVHDMEEAWQQSFMRRYAWVPLISSASTPWLIMMALVVAGWVRKRRRRNAKLAEWEDEEREEDERLDEEDWLDDEGEP